MGPKAIQNDPKRSLRVSKKANPHHKTTNQPNQDDPKTVLDPPRVEMPNSDTPPGTHLGTPNGTKTEPQTVQKRSEESRGQKSDPRRSWTRLGAILGRSWPHLGVSFGQKPKENSMFRERITCSKISRFADGSGTNLGRKMRQHDRK